MKGKLCSKVVLAVLLLWGIGCGDEESSAGEGNLRCEAGEVYNPVSGVCVPGGEEEESGDLEEGLGDGEGAGDGEEPGDGEGAGDGEEPGDGEITPPVFCSPEMDLDAEIECSFLAHSASTLYRIDPFRETVETLGSVPTNLFDIDTHPDGRIFGITTQTLYRKNALGGSWETVGNMGIVQNANGLCIDTGGRAYITATNRLYEVDLETANVSQVGSMGTGVSSSGDCVIDKGNRLYMSSTGAGSDRLVEIDALSAETTMIGPTGFSQIYGLTAAWGLLIGTTGAGEVILISPFSGNGELLFQTSPSIVFFGAASTPER